MIMITESAKQRVSEILAEEPEGSFMRISVDGGGCSGFAYAFSFDTVKTADDRDFGDVVVDDVSLSMLQGGLLDYTQDLARSGFIITNPNASATCGCGNSFNL